MSDETQQRAYIYAYTPEDIKKMQENEAEESAENEDDDARGVVIIDILGE
jgi:hypothetical protein